MGERKSSKRVAKRKEEKEKSGAGEKLRRMLKNRDVRFLGVISGCSGSFFTSGTGFQILESEDLFEKNGYVHFFKKGIK